VCGIWILKEAGDKRRNTAAIQFSLVSNYSLACVFFIARMYPSRLIEGRRLKDCERALSLRLLSQPLDDALEQARSSAAIFIRPTCRPSASPFCSNGSIRASIEINRSWSPVPKLHVSHEGNSKPSGHWRNWNIARGGQCSIVVAGWPQKAHSGFMIR
jgi:hypothetical protein